MLQFYGSNTLRCGKLKILLWLEPISYHQIMFVVFFVTSVLLFRCRHGIFVIEPSISFGFPLCCFFNDCTRRHRAPEQSSSNRNNFEWTPSAVFVAGSSFSTHTFFDSCRVFGTTHIMQKIRYFPYFRTNLSIRFLCFFFLFKSVFNCCLLMDVDNRKKWASEWEIRHVTLVPTS